MSLWDVFVTNIRGEHVRHIEENGSALLPANRVNAAKKAGLEIIGEARRKPKHFEILGRKGVSSKSLNRTGWRYLQNAAGAVRRSPVAKRNRKNAAHMIGM